MRSLYTSYVKRLADLLLALILIIALSPLFIFVPLLLAISGHGKPFFLQRRPGRYGKLFTIVKFRTMNEDRDQSGALKPDAERLTAVGRLVRSASIDELPQLFNVLLGDMSMVGPRPLLEEYIPLYSEDQSRRHRVRPGITGWAQVMGRNTLAWEEKFSLDTWYVDHCSFWLDCRIMALTLKRVWAAEGINSNTSATMEKFSGSLNCEA